MLCIHMYILNTYTYINTMHVLFCLYKIKGKYQLTDKLLKLILSMNLLTRKITSGIYSSTYVNRMLKLCLCA